MEDDDALLIDDDLDNIYFGFSRRFYNRDDFFETMDNMFLFRRFCLRKPTVLQVLQHIESLLEFDNDL